MFKIFPIQEKDEQKRVAELCGSKYREGYFAYVMTDIETGEVMGFSQFEIAGGVGYISDIKERAGLDDFEAMFILGRQTMNFIDICGAHECRLENGGASERLSKAIGFKMTPSGEYFSDMTGMFDGHCSGHTVKLD